MTDQSSAEPSSLPSSRQFLPVLLLLFVGSGCSALIYEIVWFQMLQLVIGSSAVSLGVLLGTFMGGMCLGSILMPRLISARWHPLRVYALLELGIGAIAIALLALMKPDGWVGHIYTENVGHGLGSILFRGGICAMFLLPPTILMGATLPAIARWVESTPKGVAKLGFFYGANIAGAVFGCLLAGFYLLRVYDMETATYVAVVINGAVGVLSLGLSSLSTYQRAEQQATPKKIRGSWCAYIAIGLSGMCALGAEVIWARQLSLMLGASVYTFSIILAVFLVGLGIGSSVGSVLSRGKSPQLALGWCQLLSAASIAWAAYALAKSLPFWPIDPSLASTPWMNFQLDIMRCTWAILPAACFWGASFPLAIGSAAARGQDTGRLVGAVYAANTVGAIVGALGCSILVIGWLGTQLAQQVLIGASLASALLMFVAFLPTLVRSKASDGRLTLDVSPRSVGAFVSIILVLGAAGLIWAVPQAPRGLIAYGRTLPWQIREWGEPDYIYVGEGMNASIAVSEVVYEYEGVEYTDRNFHVSGKIVASSLPKDMRLQRMLGHLPALVHPQPKSVLIVGCGAGVTAGSFVVHPDIERIVICEIEPLIPPAAGEYFGLENHYVMDDDRVEIIYDDARHYVLTTDEKFDIITSDPIHPWVKGAAALYSEEYFELCKRRLNPGGVVTQWVPLYETNEAAVKSEFATFFKVFPGGTIWANLNENEGYDVVLLGRAEAIAIDSDDLQNRLRKDDHVDVLSSLESVGFWSAVDLLATYAGRAADLEEWLEDAEINRDANLRLQYLAGMGLNSQQAEDIYDEFIKYYRYPDDLFSITGQFGVDLYYRLQPAN